MNSCILRFTIKYDLHKSGMQILSFKQDKRNGKIKRSPVRTHRQRKTKWLCVVT